MIAGDQYTRKTNHDRRIDITMSIEDDDTDHQYLANEQIQKHIIGSKNNAHDLL